MEEIATFEYGHTATATDKGEFRYIRITDIDDYGEILEQEKKYIDLSSKEEQEKYLLKEEDIIVARTGSIGKTAIFHDNEKSIFASYLIRINLSKEIILPKYYWYFTKSQEYWEQVEELTRGTIQPQFNANSLKEIKIPIPSLKEQKRIVSNWKETKGKIIASYKEVIRVFQEEEQEILNIFWGES